MNFKKIFRDKYFRIFIFFLTLYATFILRAHNYEKVPPANHLDEMLYAWSGLYLIETGVPISWSTLDYPKRAEVFKGRVSYRGGIPDAWVTLYRPWLDEPPLFSLIVGYFAHINQAIRTDFIPSSYIRIPAVIIATFTSMMIFLIARLVSGYWIGILSMILYGTIPIFVFASRSAMPENLIALIFTVIFYLLLKFLDNQKSWLIYPIPILVGIAGLAKPTGYLLLLFCLFITFTAYYQIRKFKSAIYSSIYLILATIPFLAAYFIYGYLMDAEIFTRILSIQSNRPVGFGSLAWYFITPSYKTDLLLDSWFVFCLFSAGFFIFKLQFFKKLNKLSNKSPLVIFAFVYTVLMVMLSGGQNDLLGWYRFPSYPFLAIIGAWGLRFLFNKADFFAVFLIVGMLLGNRLLLSNAFRDDIHPQAYRNILSILLLPSMLGVIFRKKFLDKLCKIIIVTVAVIGLYINIIFIYNAFEIFCESKSCPLVPSTKLSTVHFPFFWRFMVLGKPDRY